VSRPARFPLAGWIAAGAAAVAGAAALGVPHGPLLTGTAAALPGAVALALLQRRAPARAPLVVAAIGALVVALRVWAGPAVTPPPPLPEIGGPWRATVESTGSPRDGRQVARLILHTGTGGVPVAANLPAWPEVSAGAEVEVDGRLRPPPDGGYGEYLRRTGATGTLEARSLSLVEPAPGATLQGLRDAAGDALERALPEPEAGLAAGILIGLRERVDRELATDFTTAGVSHIVAISGWNIAIVAALVGAVLRGRNRRAVSLAVAATVAAYVLAAGASPSVVRAAVMAGVVLLARESGRAGRAPAALAWAAVILLVVEPRMIEDAGFRLSVLATAGLVAWASSLGGWIDARTGRRLPGWVVEGLGVSLAAQVATLPDVLATFGRLSLVAPAVNLAVVPLVPIAMAAGVLALIGGTLAMLGAPDAVAVVAGLPAWLVLHVIVGAVGVGASIPLASLAIPAEAAVPAGLTAVGLIAVGLHAIRRRRARRAPPGPGGGGSHQGRPGRGAQHGTAPRRIRVAIAVPTALVLALGSLVMVDAADRVTRLTVLDVGQGDAILLETAGGARLLVDGGPDPGRLLVQLDARIPAWDRRIDIVLLTHPHEDHVAGLVRVLDRYRVGRVLETGMRGPGPGWAAWAERLRDGPPRGTLAAGASLRLGEVRLSVLWPAPGSVPLDPPDSGKAINNASVVLLGEAHGRRFLLTADAEEDIDPELLAHGLPRIDVLKVSHHGGATATTARLLETTRPRIAVVSAGRGNTYGHPAPSTLRRLRDVGARVLRTDLDGTVAMELREEGVAIRTEGVRAADMQAEIAAATVSGAPPGQAGPAGAGAAAFLCAVPVPLVARAPCPSGASSPGRSRGRPVPRLRSLR
jgi:competence protein ComEC